MIGFPASSWSSYVIISVYRVNNKKGDNDLDHRPKIVSTKRLSLVLRCNPMYRNSLRHLPLDNIVAFYSFVSGGFSSGQHHFRSPMRDLWRSLKNPFQMSFASSLLRAGAEAFTLIDELGEGHWNRSRLSGFRRHRWDNMQIYQVAKHNETTPKYVAI